MTVWPSIAYAQAHGQSDTPNIKKTPIPELTVQWIFRHFNFLLKKICCTTLRWMHWNVEIFENFFECIISSTLLSSLYRILCSPHMHSYTKFVQPAVFEYTPLHSAVHTHSAFFYLNEFAFVPINKIIARKRVHATAVPANETGRTSNQTIKDKMKIDFTRCCVRVDSPVLQVAQRLRARCTLHIVGINHRRIIINSKKFPSRERDNLNSDWKPKRMRE